MYKCVLWFPTFDTKTFDLCVLIYLKALLFIFLAAEVLLEAGLCWEMDF